MEIRGRYRYFFDEKTPLSTGAFGRTFKGICMETGEAVRIKIRSADFPVSEELPAAVCPPIREILKAGKELKVVIETFVEGTDLKNLLKGEGRARDAEDILSMAESLGQDLARFHEAGWVHGDVKPSNIINTSGLGMAAWRLIDLDTAAPIGRRWAPYSFVYAPPELVLGHKDLYNASGDIFSLALVLWEYWTGAHYLKADHPAALLQMQISCPMPAHRRIPKEALKVLRKAATLPVFPRPPQTLPKTLQVQGCLQALEQRFHHVQDFVAALRKALHS
ncbi:MAG: protein kinase [Flavobacteriales bacterium]|nr:protein kinase [Flavobacteriales bacterium]MDW8432276.1 protein kinase [Flavobacteriales bacterium]